MLLRWRDEVVAHVAPHRVALTRIRRSLRGHAAQVQSSAVADGQAGQIAPAIECLRSLLSDSSFQDATVRVILGDAFVRYGVVPAPAVKLDADGRLSHARYILADLYGDSLSDWAITLTDAPPGQAYLACAMPSALKTDLEEALLAARLQLTSLQPQLVCAFQAWRRQLPADAGWFVTMDERTLTAVQLQDGEWRRIHTARLRDEWCPELQRLRALGRYTAAPDGDGRFYVDAPAAMRSFGREAMPDLDWLEPTARLAASAELLLLERTSS